MSIEIRLSTSALLPRLFKEITFSLSHGHVLSELGQVKWQMEHQQRYSIFL